MQHDIKNVVRGIDDDEAAFLDKVDDVKAELENKRLKEEKEELENYRKMKEKLFEESEERRIKETSKNDYQSETKTVMVQGEYGEVQITKGKLWNVCGEITDTSKNDYLGNVLIVQRPEDTHRDGPGINQSETKAVTAQRLTNQLSKPTRKKQIITTTKPPGSRICKPNHQD